jgi:hypothetical protein
MSTELEARVESRVERVDALGTVRSRVVSEVLVEVSVEVLSVVFEDWPLVPPQPVSRPRAVAMTRT